MGATVESRHMVSTPTAMPSSADGPSGVYRTALEGVVEILAVNRGAVDEGRARGGERAGVADRRAGAVVVPAGHGAAHIILVTRDHAEADHIDEQILALAPHGRGQRVERADARCQRSEEH